MRETYALKLPFESAVNALIRQRVQGIIAVPTGSPAEATLWQSVLDHHIALVFVDREMRWEPRTVDAESTGAKRNVDTVTIDNKKGAHDATWHLFVNGHLRVGILCGPDTTSTLRDRLDGFRDAHTVKGLPLDPKLIQASTFAPEDRLRAARALLALPTPPTAVFAASNLLGESMLTAIRETWDDTLPFTKYISLVMFDDAPWARLIVPRITTVSNPAPDLAKTAFDLLMHRMAQPSAPLRHVVLRGGLVVRESVSDLLLERNRAEQEQLRQPVKRSPASTAVLPAVVDES